VNGAKLSLGHFGTSAELSQHFMKGPKCLWDTSAKDTSALVPKCLNILWKAEVSNGHQWTLRH